mmetsp:Transcript_35795/g.72648  ORF Transcript_35795/g.72648 Transcript_35795/m.72648 type:complete len:112 (+) Transcript_35795:1784-2119(+)
MSREENERMCMMWWLEWHELTRSSNQHQAQIDEGTYADLRLSSTSCLPDTLFPIIHKERFGRRGLANAAAAVCFAMALLVSFIYCNRSMLVALHGLHGGAYWAKNWAAFYF